MQSIITKKLSDWLLVVIGAVAVCEPIGGDLADAVVVDEGGEENEHVEYLMRLTLHNNEHNRNN